MSDEDMEDYGFEYSDESAEEENVDIENQYYHAKEFVENNENDEALSGFASVVDMQSEKGEWGFKALKQIVKLRYKLGQYQEMMDAYKQMLTYVKSSVTRNDAEKKINSLLDYVSASTSTELLQEFYDVTLSALQVSESESLKRNKQPTTHTEPKLTLVFVCLD
jgi:COP9 signalosome complex subunit 2